MTSLLFNIYFYVLTALFALSTTPLLLLPSNNPLRGWIHTWAKAVRFGMKHIAGITVEIRGREHMPRGETAIIAAKHHSFVDAILLFAEIPHIAAVAMAELKDVPLVGLVFRKLEMIMVDRERGGAHHLSKCAVRAIASQRPILIYPEGMIPQVGERVPYKKGVWYLKEDLNLPVIPVATNIGLRWSQNKREKKPGHAIIEFMAPVVQTREKDSFMSELEARIEQRTALLVAGAHGICLPSQIMAACPVQ